MRDLVRVCAESELPGEGQACEITSRRLCVARVDGRIVVMDNECPHSGAPLGKGIVEDGRVVCPLHGWAFDGNTGEALHDASAKVSVYESVVRDGMLLVRPPG